MNTQGNAQQMAATAMEGLLSGHRPTRELTYAITGDERADFLAGIQAVMNASFPQLLRGAAVILLRARADILAAELIAEQRAMYNLTSPPPDRVAMTPGTVANTPDIYPVYGTPGGPLPDSNQTFPSQAFTDATRRFLKESEPCNGLHDG